MKFLNKKNMKNNAFLITALLIIFALISQCKQQKQITK